jgi:hypothetical protein
MKHHTRIKLNDTHMDAVRRARLAHDDTQGAMATRYMNKALSQAVAQIQRPSRQAVETVRVRFTQRFLEAIK